ncbi:GDP-fucose synthetase [Candidatus Roizmanbacteria bacterium CG_4_10_14_0_8_um_filter_33_9]|uniref:GDP-L-fucose synthase n=1 Tax=Candidatus Roizmanbacteria bacterium CG_4_10_14_0_8_um_filter_33_9 TaxID=1974826 RepID=A0A2M7QHY1_9BACT|nr:MAG: GDP-fucose synthetase [Candidatus Roizmanbacteria bacterium CG_4_10_14_0_8_um_filter_33_9]
MDEISLRNKTILVTGGQGFLGSHVVVLLQKESPKAIISPSSKEYDLRSQTVCEELMKKVKPDIVIHLAANVGGIGYNREFPGLLFYDNLTMGVHVMHEAWKAKVKKFVAIGTICAYPKFTPVPFKEAYLWNGYPEETNAPYGLAKKMLLVQSQAYRTQYGFNSIFLLPVNLYGPGDNFDNKSSHVIPALIKKFVTAKEKKESKVTVWGTGAPTREFLYVEDGALAIVLATKRYNKPEPVNLGSSFELSIHELAHQIGDVVGFQGTIEFDVTKPDGQPRRKLDVSRADEEFDFKSSTSFEVGLKRTVEWYKKEFRIQNLKRHDIL